MPLPTGPIETFRPRRALGDSSALRPPPRVPISPRQQRRSAQISIALLPHRPPAASLSHLLPDAISCLGGFQPPVAGACGEIIVAGG